MTVLSQESSLHVSKREYPFAPRWNWRSSPPWKLLCSHRVVSFSTISTSCTDEKEKGVVKLPSELLPPSDTKRTVRSLTKVASEALDASSAYALGSLVTWAAMVFGTSHTHGPCHSQERCHSQVPGHTWEACHSQGTGHSWEQGQTRKSWHSLQRRCWAACWEGTWTGSSHPQTPKNHAKRKGWSQASSSVSSASKASSWICPWTTSWHWGRCHLHSNGHVVRRKCKASLTWETARLVACSPWPWRRRSPRQSPWSWIFHLHRLSPFLHPSSSWTACVGGQSHRPRRATDHLQGHQGTQLWRHPPAHHQRLQPRLHQRHRPAAHHHHSGSRCLQRSLHLPSHSLQQRRRVACHQISISAFWTARNSRKMGHGLELKHQGSPFSELPYQLHSETESASRGWSCRSHTHCWRSSGQKLAPSGQVHQKSAASSLGDFLIP